MENKLIKMAWDGAKEDTPFNMAMMFFITLNKLLVAKDEAFINDDYTKWFKVLKAIARKIDFKTEKEDREKLKDLFGRCKGSIICFDRSPIFAQDTYDVLDEIDTKLTEIMAKKHMIFPKIKIEGGLEAFAKKYGLEE